MRTALLLSAMSIFVYPAQAADEPVLLRYLKAARDVAAKEYQLVQKANANAKGAVPQLDIDRTRLHAELAQLRLDAAKMQFQMWQLESELRTLEYEKALDANKKAPNTISALEIERLRIRAQIAKLKAEAGGDIESILPEKSAE